MKVLLVEDEPKIARYVAKALTEEGHVVEVIPRGDDGLTAATTQPYDLLLLDLALPGKTGLEILRAVRDKSIATPVLILTARGELPDRISGLDQGADDYLAKPFAMEELIARINVLTRRKGADNSPLLRVGELILNTTTRDVTRGPTKLYLSVREFGLLEFLMRHSPRAFTRTELCEHVWKSGLDDETNAVDVYIQRVRRKVDEDFPVKYIQTVRNVGYKIEAPSLDAAPK
jgi:DNA-binding response OmpR family regulator